MVLSLLGFALTAFAFTTGFGPAGGGGAGTESIVVTGCYDIVSQSQGLCGTSTCSESGCLAHYSCTSGNLTLAIAGNTWADTTTGTSYTQTCTKCNIVMITHFVCRKGLICDDPRIYTFWTPVGVGPCMVCCPL